jgi:hypothetical protein
VNPSFPKLIANCRNLHTVPLLLRHDLLTGVRRAPIVLAAARNNVPAVYCQSDFARDGAPSKESMD